MPGINMKKTIIRRPFHAAFFLFSHFKLLSTSKARQEQSDRGDPPCSSIPSQPPNLVPQKTSKCSPLALHHLNTLSRRIEVTIKNLKSREDQDHLQESGRSPRTFPSQNCQFLVIRKIKKFIDNMEEWNWKEQSPPEWHSNSLKLAILDCQIRLHISCTELCINRLANQLYQANGILATHWTCYVRTCIN